MYIINPRFYYIKNNIVRLYDHVIVFIVLFKYKGIFTVCKSAYRSIKIFRGNFAFFY